MTAHIFNRHSTDSWGELLNLRPTAYGTTVVPPEPVPTTTGIPIESFELTQLRQESGNEIARLKAEIAELRRQLDAK